MRIRNMSYADYGLTEGEEKLIIQYIQSHGFNRRVALMKCAEEANRDIANQVYFSLACGISYDNLEKIVDMPIPKVDFYAYRRKTLALFRDEWLLRERE